MGLAWIDLVPVADCEVALAGFCAAKPLLSQQPKGFALEADAVAVELPDGRYRIQSWSGDYGQIVDLVVRLAEGTGLVSHAFIGLDHDEYGAEHIVRDHPWPGRVSRIVSGGVLLIAGTAASAAVLVRHGRRPESPPRRGHAR